MGADGDLRTLALKNLSGSRYLLVDKDQLAYLGFTEKELENDKETPLPICVKYDNGKHGVFISIWRKE